MWDILLPGSMTQTILVGLIVGLIIYRFMRNRKYNMPPGPISLPLIGNLLQLRSDGRYNVQFYEWSKKYGPVMTVTIGPLRMVIVNDVETAMEVLVKKSADFAGRIKTHSLGRMTDGFKDIGFSDYGPTWKLHRKICTQALRHYMIGQALEDRIHTALKTVFPVLEEKTEPFYVNEIIDYLISNLLTGLCFGGKFEYGDKEVTFIYGKIHEYVSGFGAIIPEDFIPGLHKIYKSKAMKKLDKLYDDLFTGFFAKKYYENKKTFNKNNLRHVTDTLLLAKEEAEREEGRDVDCLSDVYLIQAIADIFIAGTDTTRLVLCFSILYMVAYPDIQTKVREEIDSVVGLDRLPGVADRPNLSYTEAVLHEAIRLSTVAPSGLLHSTLCDTEISGYRIPKDTVVMVNLWALHHDPNAWKDVDKFIPERYLDENGKLGPKPPNWLPFSAGKRVCLGEFVAKPELHLLFASLMQQFTWSAEPGVKPDLEPEGNFIIAPPAPYKVNVSRRK